MNANEKNISYIKEVSTKEGKAELCDIKEEKVLEDLFPKTSNIKEEASHCIPPTKIDIPIVEDVILKQVLPSKDNSQLRTFKTIKPHIPLIKFRKGGLALQSIAANVGQVSEMPVDSLSNKTNPMATKVYSLEWWQTPSKFKRRTIDELECDAINNGGGDRLWQ
ncbi:uncharacterized protein [Lepeophtheirus salmonis]|uniref:uncharacterized protein n=1 Tax=Lepeophtheirus salmonis TaxID=72036 RepID=UPI001AE2C232|nr:uncharacterized protein LOC121121351 isoform X1 [Lepeophtheirus salmonis]